jgi:hypothetical protein
VRGQVVFSEDLEAALVEIGAGRQHVAVLLGVLEGLPTVVLLSEDADHDWRSSAATLLRRQAGGARVTVSERATRHHHPHVERKAEAARAVAIFRGWNPLGAAPHRHLEDAIA